MFILFHDLSTMIRARNPEFAEADPGDRKYSFMISEISERYHVRVDPLGNIVFDIGFEIGIVFVDEQRDIREEMPFILSKSSEFKSGHELGVLNSTMIQHKFPRFPHGIRALVESVVLQKPV